MSCLEAKVDGEVSRVQIFDSVDREIATLEKGGNFRTKPVYEILP